MTAERLFAERGINGPSLEEIGVAAGQRNKTAVQYHFGDRGGLVSAIVEHRSSATQGMRAKMLAQMLAEGREPDVRSMVTTIVVPVASQLGRGNHYMGFQAQLSLDIGPFGAGGELATIRETLQRLIPTLPAEIFALRWGIALDTNVLTLAHIERQLEHSTLPVPLETRVADLIEVLVGIFTAPAPPPSPTAPPPRTLARSSPAARARRGRADGT